ncbi:MAG: Ig-like domain-containing protein [Verrucomicrobiota bacterium]
MEIRNVSRTRPGKCLELPPTISRHPQPQVALEGGVARFDLGAGGTAPFQYQWLLAGQPLAGATNAVLTLAGVDLADAGLYSVIVSNLLGSSTSRTAALTVFPANQCLPPAYGLVAFWRGESNVVDELGRHPASWGTNTIPAYTTTKDGGGKVATAFRFNGANHLQIPSDADLNVGAGGGFTIEGWIKPDSIAGIQPVWDWNDNRQNIGVGLLLGRTGPGALEVTLTDTNAFNTTERTITLTTPNYTLGSLTNQTPRWTHLALTFDKAARNVALYVDGRLVAERSIPLVYYSTPIYDYRLFSPATTGNLYFGWRPSGTYSGSRFRGALDELSVYYRALTPLELQAIYIVGANGKCPPAPTCQTFNPSIISWWRGESNALDSVDGNHGLSNPSPGGPGITYTNGIVGLGFKTASSRYVQIPASPSLNVGTSTGLTFETWFKLDSANSTFALASWNLGSTQGVYIGTSPTRWPNYLEANLVDTSGISRVLSYYNYSPSVSSTQTWQHLALTYDKPSGQAILYLSGSPVVVTNLGSFTPRTTGVLNLGYRPQTTIGGASLTGTLDETTLYNRALSASEITANYRNVANRCMEPPVIVSHSGNLRVNAGSNVVFTVTATGSPLLRYQWGLDRSPAAPNALLPGQTNTSLTLTNVQAKDAGRYWLRVTNAFGMASVSNLVLTINTAPRANNQTATTPEDTARNITLSASDLNQDLLFYTVLTQPTNGTLSGTAPNLVYTPRLNFFGADSFTFKASDGLLDSAPATVAITVTPVNDSPTATSQIVATDEDLPLPITLQATDVDGDPLTFTITPPAHGALSGIAPNLVYTPHANYFGEDLFTFTVTDNSNAVSELAAVSITVRPVNDTPVARIDLAPLDELPGITNAIVIAPVCCTATLRLDASQSSDVENEPLSYTWLIGTNVLSTDVIVTNYLAPGTYEITLIVSDGTAAASQTRTVEILAATEVVDYLTLLVEASVPSRNTQAPLLNWLRETGKAFDRCNVAQGVHFLELFRDRVTDRIKPTDPELAQSLIDIATAIIEAAPDCDPCKRLGRKNHKHDRNADRDDQNRHEERHPDRDDQDHSSNRNSDARARNDRESKSEREAATQNSHAEMRPLISDTGVERAPTKSR